MFYGFEEKGIEDIKSCIKKCSTLGGGIATVVNTMGAKPQLCVAINFDFSSHKCYLFPPVVNGLRLCAFWAGTPTTNVPIPGGFLIVSAEQGRFQPQISSRLLVSNPFVVTVFMCKFEFYFRVNLTTHSYRRVNLYSRLQLLFDFRITSKIYTYS